MKRVICIFFLVLTFCSATVYASEVNGYVVEEVPYDLENIEVNEDLPCPYTLYIMGATTHITDKGDGKIHMGVEVYCTHTMKKITTTFYLQQLFSGIWRDVCEVEGYVDDSSFMIKFISVSYPPSGTYRVRTLNMVEDYNGYAEVVEGYSGDIHFVSPYT